MSEDTKKAAWLAYCRKLENLSVDPYSPDLPADDPRHEQVQAIVTEYKAATTHKLALPLNWEGREPIQAVDSLPDLAEWLAHQRQMVKCWELAGDKAKPTAVNDASRAIRNSFRVLDWLGVEDHPERPLPTDDLEAVKRQIDNLERWIREKHKTGWKPSGKRPSVNPATTATHGKCRGPIPADEANLLAGKFLKQNPEADSRELAKGIGIALGRVSKLPAWRAVNARRSVAKLPLKKTPLPLTKKMIESIERGEDPAVIVEAREAAWRKLIETASADKRAELFAMTKEQQNKLIDLALEQYRDRLGDGEDCT
jgi:hypothetical protein